MGDQLVQEIKPFAKKTRRAGADALLGGFGAFFDVKAAGFKDPLLVASTDGVGTKLRVAIDTGYHDEIGKDLVAMCVNDLIVQGATPLFFLDYFATGKLKLEHATSVIKGIAEGCLDAGCALIGGETAEMPGMYAENDYDVAGFSVGAVERNEVLTGENIHAGDIILGLSSSGLHSNGFSLVRKIVEKSGLSYQDPAPFAPRKTLGQALLTPTKIYVKSALEAFKLGKIKGMAHITGGGFWDNIPRILPDNVMARVQADCWEPDPVFAWLKKTGEVSSHEMLRTFNCGIGMIVIVSHEHGNAVSAAFEAAGEMVTYIGVIEPRKDGEQVIVENMDGLWR